MFREVDMGSRIASSSSPSGFAVWPSGMTAGGPLSTALIAILTMLALASVGIGAAQAGTTTHSVPIGAEVLKGNPQTYGLQILAAPGNAVITNVEAQFDYTAYGGLEDYVSVRFNRGSAPGASGGVSLVSLGGLPASPPTGGTYSWASFSNPSLPTSVRHQHPIQLL